MAEREITWDTPFATDMIGGPNELAVWCESGDDAKEFLGYLLDNGCRWASSATDRSINWDSYREETVYFIHTKRTITFGDRDYVYRYSESENYFTCKYCGLVAPAIIDVEDLL